MTAVQVGGESCLAWLARGRGVGVLVSLLVCEPVSSVEQLLSRQPILGDVTGLPADQVVRHDVRINPHQSFSVLAIIN